MPARALCGLFICLLLLTVCTGTTFASEYHFLLKFENRSGGRILLVDLTRGEESPENTFLLGRVLRPATDIRRRSFHATLWAKTGTVAASAVNGIHIKVTGLADLDRGSTISMLPRELYGQSLQGNPESLHDYAIYTSIASGAYLFGGSFSPTVGSRAWVVREKRRQDWGIGFRPRTNDVITIEVVHPDKTLCRLSINNREGGFVLADYANGTAEAVARVVRPVAGVGRFPGTALAPGSSIRAAHAAVIDISTSPRGKIGGFQIIPLTHSFSSEMLKSQVEPVYLIVDSLSGKAMMGVAPLFEGYFAARTGDRREPPLMNLAGHTVETSLLSGLPEVKVLADFGEGLKPLPVAVGRDDNALRGMLKLVLEFSQSQP